MQIIKKKNYDGFFYTKIRINLTELNLNNKFFCELKNYDNPNLSIFTKNFVTLKEFVDNMIYAQEYYVYKNLDIQRIISLNKKTMAEVIVPKSLFFENAVMTNEIELIVCNRFKNFDVIETEKLNLQFIKEIQGAI